MQVSKVQPYRSLGSPKHSGQGRIGTMQSLGLSATNGGPVGVQQPNKDHGKLAVLWWAR